jgi:hypothetical protein
MSENQTGYMAEKKNEVPKIYPALLAAMVEIGAIGKTRKNPQQGYNFRGIDDVLNNLQPALIKAKVFVVPRIVEMKREEKASKTGGVITYTIVTGEYDFCSAEDGSKITARTYGEGLDVSDKSTNKAMSAALKYAIIQTLAIPTEELFDSERDHIEPQAQYITAEESEKIRALIDETKSNLAAFLKYANATSIETIYAADLQRALVALNKKKQPRAPGVEG